MAKKQTLVRSAILVIVFGLGLIGLFLWKVRDSEGQDLEKDLRKIEARRKAFIDWSESADPEQVQENVEEFFARIIDGKFDSRKTYIRLVNAIWKAKPETLEKYEETIKKYPWPREAYYFSERTTLNVLKEIERAKEPRATITNPKVRKYVDEFFGHFTEFGGTGGFSSRDVALKIIDDADQSKEKTVKEYIAALRQHPWPCNYRDYIEFLLFLLQNPQERRGFLERLEPKRKGQYEIKPIPLEIARENVAEFFKILNSTRSEDKKEDIHLIFSGEAESYLRPYQYYLLALEERKPWPLSEKDQEEIGSIVRSYTRPDIQPYTWEDNIAEDHFDLELAFWEGYPQYRQAARECVEELFEGIMSENKKEMREAGERFLDKIQQPELLNKGFFYECNLALYQHPQPIWGKRARIFYEVRNEFHELRAEVMTGRIAKRAEDFLKGIVSKDPLKRKEAIFLLLPKFLHLAVIDESQDLIAAIRKHPLPEDEEAKRRIETVISCFEEQADFFAHRWEELASPSGKEEVVPDEVGTQSQRLVAVGIMAGEGYFKVDHWPSIIRDENRPLIDRFWAAFYLAKYYAFFDSFAIVLTSEGKMDLSKFEPDERRMAKAMIELGGKFEKEIESLRAGEDEKIIFWIDLGLAHQELLQDFRPYIPALLKALESGYLYFRILSQHRLEELTGKAFPLDPTDPAELRAPAIAQWKKWWEENKAKLHYDLMKDLLVP